MELIALFGKFIENRPSDANIHPHLKDSMVYRKFCNEKEGSDKRGCFNILHLGIAISDTEFTNRLQAHTGVINDNLQLILKYQP